MAKAVTRLEITRDLLDFGTSIARLDQVASVGRGERRPLRLMGAVLLLVAAGLFGYEAWFNPAAFSIKAAGSTRLWAACCAAGAGLFSLIYVQRCLIVALAGGTRIMLRVSNAEFAARVLREIRTAMTSPPGTAIHVVADLAAEEILTSQDDDGVPTAIQSAAAPLPHQLPPHQQAPAGGPLAASSMPPRQADWPGSAPHATSMQPARPLPNGAGGWPSHGAAAASDPGLALRNVPANGGAYYPAPLGDPRRGPHEALAQAVAAGVPSMRGYGGPAGQAAGFAPAQHQPVAHPMPGPSHVESGPRLAVPPGNRELAQLIDFVSRAQVQHKDALLDLLKVVEDHHVGGRTSRDDAMAHWQSFADYVGQYLGGVEGLAAMTERAGRSIGRSA
jgi:hypothetical protein